MVITTLWFLWELPQNLTGLILLGFYRHKIINLEKLKRRVFIQVNDFGISLGQYIFWSANKSGNNKKHEFGHSVQSRILGPVYLIIVGLPSLMRAVYGRIYFKKHKSPWKNYYKSFPENWADRLGEKYF